MGKESGNGFIVPPARINAAGDDNDKWGWGWASSFRYPVLPIEPGRNEYGCCRRHLLPEILYQGRTKKMIMADTSPEKELCDRFRKNPETLYMPGEIFIDLMQGQANPDRRYPVKHQAKKQEVVIKGGQVEMTVLIFLQK